MSVLNEKMIEFRVKKEMKQVFERVFQVMEEFVDEDNKLVNDASAKRLTTGDGSARVEIKRRNIKPLHLRKSSCSS